MPQTRVGLVVPTLDAGEPWAEFLAALAAQTLRPARLLDVDSSSSDGTPAAAASSGFEVVRIERTAFNHGGTRQWAANHLADCDIVVFMTQDAILADERSLESLVACFEDPSVAVAYGRQLPHKRATSIESHARIFNYGARSLKKNLASLGEFGTKVFFCSNSFAAYRRSVLSALGGFRDDLILGEDMEFAARAIGAGYANLYCATATVHHSHDYSASQTLARYFDIGVFDAENAWMRRDFGSHGGEGARFVASEFKYLLARDRFAIPRAFVLTAAKLAGYRLGRLHRRLPNDMKKRLSMFPGYWARPRPA